MYINNRSIPTYSNNSFHIDNNNYNTINTNNHPVTHKATHQSINKYQFKMLSNIALSLLPLLAASVSAAPSAPSVQVQFANDVTGANGNARIPLDGSAIVLGQAYAGTNLAKNGTLFVTSLQFTADFSNVACEVIKTDVGKTVASISNFQQDFQRFSQKPLNWQTGFTISCHYGATASAPATPTASAPTTTSTIEPTATATTTATTVPSADTVQVQFANDVTGANGNARIPLDGTAVVLGDAYADTNLEKDGTLFVTSLQFTADFSNVSCEVVKTDVGKTVASISNFQKDFQRFSQKPLNWQSGFTISCHRA